MTNFVASDFPGTPQHQALLRAIVSHYQDDPRILAVAVFGSLGRGTWDLYSDIDLDVVVSDDAALNVVEEIGRLCGGLTSIGEKSALIIPVGDDAADVVFRSLMLLSVRYHPLANTHPNIVDSSRVLYGRIGKDEIAAAGLANLHPAFQSLKPRLDRCVRHAVVADNALQRKEFWLAIELLHRMRSEIMELFARSRAKPRPLQAFQAYAEHDLQAKLARTLPRYDPVSLRESLESCMEILDQDLECLTEGKVELAADHRAILDRIRSRHSRREGDGLSPA